MIIAGMGSKMLIVVGQAETIDQINEQMFRVALGISIRTCRIWYHRYKIEDREESGP